MMSGAARITILLALTALGGFCFAPAGWAGGFPIVINEFLASNSDSGTDPQGQADDWIELYNQWDTSFDVGGMYLTDDLSTPAKWRIPLGQSALTTIGPYGYLLIWADGDSGDAGLHASFSLNSSGEDVALFAADGVTLIDDISYGRQTQDVSYGRFPDGSDTWVVMTSPTPGKRNVQLSQGIVAEPAFSIDHGFYGQEVSVAITCETEGATVYYTTNGGEPYSADAGRPRTGATVYSGPVRISKTTCLRAVAVKSGWRPSPTQTRTYIFLADVIKQSPTGASPGSGWPTGSVNWQVIDYGMDPDVVNDLRYKDLIDDALLAVPSISLVTELTNLFDPLSGIYVHPYSQGQAWKRPVSVELIDPNGAEGCQIDGGLRIRGGYSRSTNNPKHAFRLFFRGEYGASRLEYPLFGDEGADEFQNVDLRTSQNYSWSFEGGNHDTFVREVFSRDTQRDMGRPYTRSRYYHLYLNGQYWGLYQTQERPEADYAETYFGGDKEDYDVVKSRAGNGGYDIEATDGTLDAWRVLWEAARSGFNDDSTYYRVQGLNADGTANPAYPKLLDVDNLIDYMLCTYYVGDPDGPVSAWARVANNFYAIYNRVQPDGFKLFRHDAEHSLYDLYESRLFAATTVAVGSLFNQSNPLWMHTHLMLHPEYRMRFVDRVYQCFFNDGPLTPQQCADRFMARANQIDLAIIGESARWGDAKRAKPRTRDDDWLPDINGMYSDYFPLRTGVVLDQFKSRLWYPSFDPPVFSQSGGHVATGFALAMQSPYEVYYTLDGADPRLPEKVGGTIRRRALTSEAGISDASESGGISPSALRYTGPVTIDKSVHVKTRALSGAAWSALNEAVFAVGPVAQSLRISEIMYHPADTGNPDDPNTEFIELTNVGAESINLNLVKFTDGVGLVFPSFDLAPGGYCLVVKDLAAFTAKYGPGLPVAGQYAGSLSNSGERIEMCDAAGTVIHSFRFEDGWFDATDGGGFSLTLKDPRTADPAALSDKSLWQPSAHPGGSPGTGGQ